MPQEIDGRGAHATDTPVTEISLPILWNRTMSLTKFIKTMFYHVNHHDVIKAQLPIFHAPPSEGVIGSPWPRRSVSPMVYGDWPEEGNDCFYV